MRPGQTLPRIWLVTDERQGAGLLPAVARLPEAGGILFRHYRLPSTERRALFDAVRAVSAGQPLFLAGSAHDAQAWGADGWHGWGEGTGPHSTSVHNPEEIRRAEALGANLLFLSPVFATRSHPGALTLGPKRFAEMAASTPLPVIALGGMSETNASELLRAGAHGWGAIDAWLD